MKIRFSNLLESSRKSGVWAALFCVLALLLAVPFAAHAQQYSGSITGTVTDPSGAAVAGATVTATDTGTNATYTATTSDLGAFTFPQMTVGTYEVRVKHPSFKEFVAKGVEVHTSTAAEVNAKLELGATTEMVTVEATDVQVQTTSAAAGEVVEGQQVRELPLNGENFMQLVTLSPGVSTANSFDGFDKGLKGGSDFSVNGNPYNNNLFLVDGVNNNDVGSNRTILVYPAVDSIAEFKMLRNSYGPEYGQAAGAIISINTRSGENQWHGGLFYAGRNDKLDANDYFSNKNGTGKAELRRNDVGYHIGGPIKKDKLFFFFNQEWNYEIRGQSFAACVANQNELAGNFSTDVANALTYLNTPYTDSTGSHPVQVNTNTIGNATTCGAAPPANYAHSVAGNNTSPWVITGSQIPSADQAAGKPYTMSSVDAPGLLLAQFYPLPNISGATGLGGANNWRASEPNKNDWKEVNVRGDYDLSKKHRITARYTRDWWTNPAPNGGAFWGDSFFTNVDSDWSQPSRSVMIGLRSQLTDTLINDVHFGWGWNAIITTLNGNDKQIVSQLETALPNVWNTKKDVNALPEVGWGGWGGLTPYGSSQTIWNIAPYGNHEDLYTIQDNLSKVHGNHTFKLGAFYSTNAKIENNNGGTDRPVITPFGSGVSISTSNPLANILMPGTGSNPQIFTLSENSIDAVAREHWHDFEWYLADDWKIRRNVTLSLGFRWSFYREPFVDGNNQAGWSLAAWSATEAAAHPNDPCNGVIIVPGTTPCQNAASALQALGVTFPFSNGTPGVNSALVNNNNHDIAPRIGIAWDVNGDGKTAVRLGVGQFYTREEVGLDERLSGTAPFVINATVNRPLDNIGPGLTSNIAVSPSAGKDPRGVTPNSWQWNLSVERELARNTALEIGYVGNSGIHLTSMVQGNPVSPADYLQSAFACQTPSNCNTTAAINALRGATNFGAINDFARQGKASYHSLQALFRSRTSNSSSFQAAYTYSHSIGNVEADNSSGSVNQEATTDLSNGRLDKGNTNINRSHIFVANEVYFLPKLTNHGAFMQNTLGGWEANSIITVESGTSLSVFTNGASAVTNVAGFNLNSLIGTGFNSNNRPLVTGTNCNAGESGNQILNPAAFTLVGYHVGTVDPKMAARGVCYGPPTRLFDLQMVKNWYFKENRFRLKFSMDAFNIFNHANFTTIGIQNGYSGLNLVCNGPGGACSPTNNVVVSGGGGTFGQTFGLVPGHESRELQYGLKLTF